MSKVNIILKYLKYVLIHKYFVFVAGLLKTQAPLWLLVIHDFSKFRPSEFIPYAKFFYGGEKSQDTQDRFDMAWLLHQRRNPHHWQYWYLMQDSGKNSPLPMPEKYVREMVADWAGAGRAITGKWEVAAWYEKNRDKVLLHPETRSLVEVLLQSFVPMEPGDGLPS